MRSGTVFRAVACALLATALAGCTSTSSFAPAKQRVKTERIGKPASEMVTLDNAEGVVVKPDGTITASLGSVTRTKTEASEDLLSESEFTGPAVKTSSAEAASKIRADSPSQTADTIGKAGISALSELASGGGFSFFYILGAVCILAGAGIGWLGKNLTMGLSVAGLGALFIGVGVTIDQWPWVWLILILAAIGLGGYLLYQNRAAFQNRLALNKIVKGVEKSPPDAQKQVKDSIKREANGKLATVDKVVDSVKAGG